MGVVHHGPSHNGELITAIVAIVLVSVVYLGYAQGATTNAGCPCRPAETLQKLAALGVGVEVVNKG